MEDVGENTTTWRMKENALTSRLGHIEPSTELELNSENVVENSYRRLVISNPSMMCIYEEGSNYPLLDIDVIAWLYLACVTGERPIPAREEMLEANRRDLLDSMQDLGQRYLLDEKYRDEINDLPSDRW
jgi:hypothetical protein